MHAGHSVRNGPFLLEQPREGHRCVAAAVKPSLEGDQIPAAGGRLAEFDRGVDRVGAGRPAEVHLHPVTQARGQHGQLRLDKGVLDGCREIQAMSEQPELIGHRPDQIGVIVPQREHTGSGEKVDEDIAVDIHGKAAGGRGDGDRQMPRIGPGVGLPPSLPGQQLGRAGSGQVTTDARGIERDGTGGQGHRAAPKQICGTQERARPNS